jgi:SAM-dependent methyltransferase
MNAEQFRLLEQIEARHWFFRGQWAISERLLGQSIPRAARLRILDAGCGTGGTSIRLRGRGSVFGIDLSAQAVGVAWRRGLPVARASLGALPFADGSFDLVTCLDVLYHRSVEDDLLALEEARRVLRPGGFLLVRVPAFRWLAGRHDRAVHGLRRYRRGEFVEKLRQAGFDEPWATYANMVALPAVLAKRLIERILPMPSDLALPPRPINRVLAMLLSMEAGWVARGAVPIGVSLLAMAQRR